MFNRLGFTLIELLVVITIIVVLLAMLAPALDKAIYQAELATCGSQLHGVAGGLITYASNNKRYYPYRAAMDDPSTGNYYIRCVTLPFRTHQKENLAGWDDRPLLRPYMSMKSLQCAPAGKIDLDTPTVGPPDGAMVFTSYSLWFGFRYYSPRSTTALPTSADPAQWGGKGMFKLGDRWEFHQPDAGGNPGPLRSYSFLAGDWLQKSYFFGFSHECAHPDHGGNLPMFVRDGGQHWAPDNPADVNTVISEWFPGAGDFFDLNFAGDDASVQRLNNVDGNSDSRLEYVAPCHNWGSTGANAGLAVPRS